MAFEHFFAGETFAGGSEKVCNLDPSMERNVENLMREW